MKPGFFIDRPVFSTVLSILIVIVGIIGLALLPVDQYRTGIERYAGYDLYAK